MLLGPVSCLLLVLLAFSVSADAQLFAPVINAQATVNLTHTPKGPKQDKVNITVTCYGNTSGHIVAPNGADCRRSAAFAMFMSLDARCDEGFFVDAPDDAHSIQPFSPYRSNFLMEYKNSTIYVNYTFVALTTVYCGQKSNFIARGTVVNRYDQPTPNNVTFVNLNLGVTAPCPTSVPWTPYPTVTNVPGWNNTYAPYNFGTPVPMLSAGDVVLISLGSAAGAGVLALIGFAIFYAIVRKRRVRTAEFAALNNANEVVVGTPVVGTPVDEASNLYTKV
jgi:hypothetical protein